MYGVSVGQLFTNVLLNVFINQRNHTKLENTPWNSLWIYAMNYYFDMTALPTYLMLIQYVHTYRLPGAWPGDHWNSACFQQDQHRLKGRQKTTFGLSCYSFHVDPNLLIYFIDTVIVSPTFFILYCACLFPDCFLIHSLILSSFAYFVYNWLTD